MVIYKKKITKFQPYLQSLLRKSKHYFLRNATTDSEIADRYVAMKSYMLLGHSFDKLVKFHIEKSKKPTYYLRYVPLENRLKSIVWCLQFIFVLKISFSVQATMRGFKAPYADEELPVKGASHVEDLCYVFKWEIWTFFNNFILAKISPIDSGATHTIMITITSMPPKTQTRRVSFLCKP